MSEADYPHATIFTGEYEVIYSRTFSLYGDKFVVRGLVNPFVEFEFKSDTNKKAGVTVIPQIRDGVNVAIIEVMNFEAPLGTATDKPLKFFDTTDGKELFFAIFATRIGSLLRQVSVTFYSRLAPTKPHA